jgi:hypothetical protein
MRREPAWRVFAGEYNDVTFELKGRGGKTPSYVVTPLGAKINRLFAIGVLTDVENISEGGELLRAHVSDPTGVFTLYSGQYQQEVTTALSEIEAPAFVAFIGKARTFEPEEGALFVSVRPEIIQEVSIEARDRWIVETCRQTKERIEAIVEALKMKEPNAHDLRKLGYSRDLAEGVVHAVKQYSDIDVHNYVAMIHESLQYLLPGREKPLESVSAPKSKKQQETDSATKEKPAKPVEQPAEESVEPDETEDIVMNTIKKLEGEEGALWDAIVKQCEKKKLSTDAIEEALTALMDKGLIYEPVLGTIKTT